MKKRFRNPRILFACAISLMLFLVGCSTTADPAPTAKIPVDDPTPQASATTPIRPAILNVLLDRTELPRYEPLEMTVEINAQKEANPYDVREIRLDGVFTDPDGVQMAIPGFWDGKDAWRIRFTPSKVGEWKYELIVQDVTGLSKPQQGKFTVTASTLHGWLLPGKSVNPAYSNHYLAYHDGTPFYGIGHGDAVTIFNGGFDAKEGFEIFNQMKKAGENYVVWWPLFTNSPVNDSYKEYNFNNMSVLDLVVRDAQKKDIFLIFTIWNHNELRDATHPWGNSRWSFNGFSQLGSIDSFFTSDEAWVWQENFYRYIIARWGYSTSIGMWQTASEINGTNAYEQTNPWHQKVNDYFVDNDPYRHPTTASKSGGLNDVDWPEGHAVMDSPQIHLYDDFKDSTHGIDTVRTAEVIANKTQGMWNNNDKPNWIGEFGAAGNTYYPEMFHNAIWSALASGAAMTPAEWNDGRDWGEMTPEMDADMLRLSQFVAEIPLVKINPAPLKITSTNEQVRGWGIAGVDGGLIWIQDFSLEGKSIEVVRKDQSVRVGEVNITGLPAGTYIITAYDPWHGLYKPSVEVTCQEGVACQIKMPKFHADLAFKIAKK